MKKCCYVTVSTTLNLFYPLVCLALNSVNYLVLCLLKRVNVGRKLCRLDINSEGGADGKPDNSEPVTYCLQALLAIEVLLNPSSDTQMFVNELLLVQRLKVNIAGSGLELAFPSIPSSGSVFYFYVVIYVCSSHYASFSSFFLVATVILVISTSNLVQFSFLVFIVTHFLFTK